MTLSQLLDRYNIRPNKERGQHFLHNELIIERMVAEADISRDDTVIDIGAGIGNITRKLAEKAENVIAVENDETLLPALQDQIKEFDNVEIVSKDILHGAVPEFDKCVSNIPFHLSSEIIEMLGEQQKLSVLLVQDAFAKRLIAKPGTDDYSRITIRANFDFTPVYLETVYDINFIPPPQTDAALLKLFPNKGKYDVDDEPFFFHTILALFTHKGKKLRNAFYDSRHMFDLDKDIARELQDQIPHSEDRVYTLNIQQLVEVAEAIQKLVEEE